MNENEKSTVKLGITFKLIALAIVPALLATIIMLFFARQSLYNGLNLESLDALEKLARATVAGYDCSSEGNYRLDSDGNLWKGNTNLSDNMSDIDLYTAGSDAELTICYGKTRVLTTLRDADTNERIVGTDVSDEVWNTIRNGETYETTGIKINGTDYYAYYMPLTNTDGTVVGVVFAGQPATNVNAFINDKVRQIALIALAAMAAAAIIGYIIAKSIASCIVVAENALDKLSSGRLSINISPKVLKRKDELGQMGRALDTLISELNNIVKDLKVSSDKLYESGNSLDEVAEKSSIAAEEISIAVEDISKGAVSQADEIKNASHDIATMGTVIESIVDNVGSLTTVSQSMSKTGGESLKTMHELSDSNDRTTAAISRIAEQIQETNASIQKISAAAELITFITDQTSLLALNASIESARAGDAGKGFAVVATEIQNLAVQSEDAANEIQNVIRTLQQESEKTIQIMEEAEKLVKEQQRKLDDTKVSFKEVSTGINETKENTDVIRNHTDTCDTARVHVIEVIDNLSSISEQNAASAEETTASMEELNATISSMSDSAKSLKELSKNLNRDMAFFKMNG
jgi:methyl-accepting chemotaxis protein